MSSYSLFGFIVVSEIVLSVMEIACLLLVSLCRSGISRDLGTISCIKESIAFGTVLFL